MFEEIYLLPFYIIAVFTGFWLCFMKYYENIERNELILNEAAEEARQQFLSEALVELDEEPTIVET